MPPTMRRDPPTLPCMARPPVPRILGAIAAPVYGLGVRARNRRFDAGCDISSVGAPVISVGNLSAGGTGKSPAVLWLALRMIEKGYTPGVATRGYKAKPGRAGDEQAEMHERLPELAIEADPVRTAAARRLIDRGCDLILLDDGFQHRRLGRDLDIVLLDATRPVFDDRLLPLGYLRESAASLGRAHAVIITRCESADEQTVTKLERFALGINPSFVIARAEHRWDTLEIDGEQAPPESLDGRPVVLACGIGNPGAFVANAQAHGALIRSTVVMRDHHDWSAIDADRLSYACDQGGEPAALLTTAKDWVKLTRHLPRSNRRFDVIVPRLSIGFTHGESDLVALAVQAGERARTGGA